MRSKFIIIMEFTLLFCLVVLSSCSTRYTERSSAATDEQGGRSSTVYSINNKDIISLETKWENEMLTGAGVAPVVNKYNDFARDKELARRGASLDAEKNLAAKISEIRVTETIIMSDLMSTTYAQSKLNAVLKDVTVVNEYFNEKENRWETTVQMPKAKLIEVVKESQR